MYFEYSVSRTIEESEARAERRIAMSLLSSQRPNENVTAAAEEKDAQKEDDSDIVEVRCATLLLSCPPLS